MSPRNRILEALLAVVILGCGDSSIPDGSLGGHCYPNGTCNQGLTCYSLSWSCGTPMDSPDASTAKDTSACIPQCGAKTCGDNGCGGSCGACPAGHWCDGTNCTSGCTPNCAGKTCGSDGCGGSCGNCHAGQKCDGISCVLACTPNCVGKSCGDDGCGGSCGSCPSGMRCAGGACSYLQAECESCTLDVDCASGRCRQYADYPGLGAFCVLNGNCTADAQCPSGWGSCDTTAHQCLPTLSWVCISGAPVLQDHCERTLESGAQCVSPNRCQDGLGTCGCVPDCAIAQCGDNGCGGSCGTCPAGSYCGIDRICYCNPCPTSGACYLKDGCGNDCFYCQQGYFCATDGLCHPN